MNLMKKKNIFTIFHLQLLGKAKECNVLERSLDRFYERTFPGQLSSRRSKSVCNDQSCSPYFEGILHRVIIKLDPNGKDCEHFAHPDMLEKCKKDHFLRPIFFKVVFLISR